MSTYADMSEFRDRLRMAAEYRGVHFGPTAIGKALGIRKQTVDRWLHGSMPEPDAISRISQTWGVDWEWLATGSGEMLPRTKEKDDLNSQERELVYTFRKLDTERRTSLQSIVKALAKASVIAWLAVMSTSYPPPAIAGLHNAFSGLNTHCGRLVLNLLIWLKKLFFPDSRNNARCQQGL